MLKNNGFHNRHSPILRAFSPRSLFASGAPGAWYDPSDYGATGTLFQDSAGTTPVTAVEQPVGLMLDKSQGLVLGPELVTNGTFTTSVSGWSIINGDGTLTWNAGKARVTGGTTNTFVGQTETLAAGRWVLISYNPTKVSATRYSIRVGGTFVEANQTTFGQRSSYLYVSSANPLVELVTYAGETVDWDDISVKELPGNHAFQATSASRPVLSARYNLLTRSEDVSVTWTKAGTATTPAANTLNLPAFNDYIYQLNVAPAGVALTLSALLSGSGTVSLVAFDNATGNFQLQEVTLTSTPTRYSFNFTFGAGASDRRAGVGRFGGNTATTVTVTNLDLRVSNNGITQPAYQRVNTATDYNTTGFLPYLKFDGVDDSLSTNSISFTSTDKMSVFAGVRKLSDAAQAILYELSTDTFANNGAFLLWAPGAVAGSNYYARVRGSLVSNAVTGASYPAPITNVATMLADIAGDSVNVRLNAASAVTSTSDLGTGNFGNYPLFIGRRNNATLPFNGQMYSMIIVGKAVTAGELSSTETWVNGKTGAYA